MDNKIIEIGFIAILITGIISNTIVACTWLKGMYKNPEAGKGALVAVLVTCGTGELTMIVLVLWLLMRILFGGA